MQLTITGYSTALFSTWYFLEEPGILFDAGDGVVSGLLQKSRKIGHVFLSHADRDHLTGLLQLNQLNARPGFPAIYYPQDSRSFAALESFSKQFDPHVSGTTWMPIAENDEVLVRDDMVVSAFRNEHVAADPGITKSLSYKLLQTKRKLRPELAGLTGEEIRQLSLANGKDSTTVEVRTTLLGYSGDTPVEGAERWMGTQTLIHEATFLSRGDVKERSFGNQHSTLEEVMAMVARLDIKRLILGHFSPRYTREQIDAAIRQQCALHKIQIPVFRLLPGETSVDILNGRAINA